MFARPTIATAIWTDTVVTGPGDWFYHGAIKKIAQPHFLFLFLSTVEQKSSSGLCVTFMIEMVIHPYIRYMAGSRGLNKYHRTSRILCKGC